MEMSKLSSRSVRNAGGSKMIRMRLAILVTLVCSLSSSYLVYVYQRDKSIVTFQRTFYDNSNTWASNKWLNVPTWQNPNDAWITQEIISEVKPDFVIETGTHRGGSALLWALVLAQVKPEGKVITVDIQKGIDAASQLPVFQERVEFLQGSSTDPETVAQIKQRIADGTGLVILDSNHSKDHVLNELRLYADFVSVGSYLIVQDTCINGHPIKLKPSFGPGPMEAVETFLTEDDRFEPDRTRERLLHTMHPKGYLQRVK